MHKNRIDWLLKIQIKNSLILKVVSIKLSFTLYIMHSSVLNVTNHSDY